jgi:hypothetical protein
MSLMSRWQILLANLEGAVPKGTLAYLPRGDVLGELRVWTGQDFGYDAARWRTYLRDQRAALGIDATEQF